MTDTNEWLKANLPGPPLALSVALSSEDIAKVSEWLTLVQSAERKRCIAACRRVFLRNAEGANDGAFQHGLESCIEEILGPNVAIKPRRQASA